MSKKTATRRYFADLYDADGEYFVFDGDKEGGEYAGPFATMEEAEKEALYFNEQHERNIERAWAFNSPRLNITLGISGDAQEGSFMNATLQGTGNDDLEFSVAIHVEIPEGIKTQDQLADYLGHKVFSPLVHACEAIHVEIQLGPYGSGEE